MACLYFYCVERDVPVLLQTFGTELAFILPDGPNRWRAVKDHVPIDGSHLLLWHVPSGPFPSEWLEQPRPGSFPLVVPGPAVADPWAGWDEPPRTLPALGGSVIAQPVEPLVSIEHPGMFRLRLNLTGREQNSTCGRSTLEWIGNHYASIGRAAPEVTVKFWARLRREIAKIATKVPEGGLQRTSRRQVWAFPTALENLDVADIY